MLVLNNNKQLKLVVSFLNLGWIKIGLGLDRNPSK
jgi:hypothetical protein